MNMTHAFIAALSEARDLHPAPQPVGNPRTMALAYRIRAHCDALGWDCTMGACATALGATLARVRRASLENGWCAQFRTTKCDDQFPWGSYDSVAQAMTTKLYEVAEVPRAGWVAE